MCLFLQALKFVELEVHLVVLRCQLQLDWWVCNHCIDLVKLVTLAVFFPDPLLQFHQKLCPQVGHSEIAGMKEALKILTGDEARKLFADAIKPGKDRWKP